MSNLPLLLQKSSLPRSIKVVGQDPSLRNWGLAQATLDIDSKVLRIDHIDVINPVLPTGKQTRVNSLDIESAFQLTKGAWEASKGAQAVFIEVPVGSQSARAMASYGICVGVLGALRLSGIPFYEVTPKEVKHLTTGNPEASKEEMIKWAVNKHPEANWPTHKHKDRVILTSAKAEHMADAIAAIYAGMSGSQFQQLLSIMTTQL